MAEYGWAGKILRLNMTSGTATTTPTSDYVPRFMGGRGIADKIYWDEVPPEVGAFDLENKLIFATGPSAGALAPQSGRLHLVGKSPTKRIRPYPDAPFPGDRYHTSNGGGYAAAEMKRAGYDAIVVEGKSTKPFYVYIKDDKVEFRDATPIVGLSVSDKQKFVYNACDKDVIMLTIGPAAEKLHRGAVITSGLTDTFGTGGYGAVMASKNLLVVAIKGTGSVKVENPSKLIDVFYDWSRAMSRKETEMVPIDTPDVEGKMAHYRGKVFKIRSWNYYHSRNELAGTDIGEKVAQGLAKFKHRSCNSCPVCCRLAIRYEDGTDFAGTCKELQSYYKLEAAYYGWTEKVDDKTVYTKTCGDATIAHAVIGNELGLSLDGGYNGLSTVQAMANAGILTPENSGLPVDKIGSIEFITALWNMEGNREGIGDLIAEEGTQLAMRSYSAEGEDLYKSTYEVTKKLSTSQKSNKLMSMSGFMDHGQFWWNLQRSSKKSLYGYAQASEEDKQMQISVGKAWFGSEQAMDDDTWEYKAMVARRYIYYLLVVDSLPACVWGSPAWYNIYTEDHIGELTAIPETYEAVTGIATTDADILKIGERIWNLERAIAVREGRTRKDDWGWYETEGDAAEQVSENLDKYYEESGWDKTTGWPTRAKLEELDLKDVADGLASLGKLP